MTNVALTIRQSIVHYGELAPSRLLAVHGHPGASFTTRLSPAKRVVPIRCRVESRSEHTLNSVESFPETSAQETNSKEISTAKSEKLLRPSSVVIPVGDRTIEIETGRMGRQASGAVTVRDGETIVYCTACVADVHIEGTDFVPLTVNYQEKYSAAGRTSGGYIKREGRPKDAEVLISRLIDRPIRPMITKGFAYDTQVLSWVLSYDSLHLPDTLAITAAGAALALSEVPLAKPVAGVRVGQVGGLFVINPTTEQIKASDLDLIVAGTADSVLMIEGFCDLLTEARLLEAVAAGQAAISAICKALEQFASAHGKPKHAAGVKKHVNTELEQRVKDILGDRMSSCLLIKEKKQRSDAMGALEQQVVETLSLPKPALGSASPKSVLSPSPSSTPSDVEEEWEVVEGVIVTDGEGEEEAEIAKDIPIPLLPVPPTAEEAAAKVTMATDVRKIFKRLASDTMRTLIIQEGLRSDGRSPTEIRQIECSAGLLPRVHGSALFTRGETQALAVATLGGEEMVQKLDNVTAIQDVQRFYLQYTFPPSCVGETGRVGFPSRREIGHGNLAERAILPVLPKNTSFPYTIRLESMITESNGSSSMASVCGGCLALLDAGVPLTQPVAGVAMGLILHTKQFGGSGEPLILSDILGSEDALGDMDFKVAGTEDGVSAFQMDIKVEGITIDVMQRALEQAKHGRRHILREMAKCDPSPSLSLSSFAPRILSMKIDPDKVSLVIGSGGKTIRSIIEESGADSIDVQDSGELRIFAKSAASLEIARARITGLTMVPEVGKIYRECTVKSVVAFGCFVEIAPGKEGLVHISELSMSRVNKTEDVVSEGDRLDVKLLEINARGQLRLSHKAVLSEEAAETAAQQ